MLPSASGTLPATLRAFVTNASSAPNGGFLPGTKDEELGVPAQWIERTKGASRFRVLNWLPAYLRWYRYAFATTFLGRPASTVKLHRTWKTAT